MIKKITLFILLAFTSGCLRNQSADIKNAEIVYQVQKNITDNPENINLLDLTGNEFPLPHSGSAFPGAPTAWTSRGDTVAYTDIGQDGQYIVFSDYLGNKEKIGSGYLSSIAPSGQKIAFLTFQNAKNGMLQVGTNKLHILSTLDGFTFTLETIPRTAWDSNDGFYFDHLDSDGIWRIYHYRISANEISFIVSGMEPSLSHDGKQLAFVDREILRFFDLERKEVVTSNDIKDGRWPSWSPDDTKIVFSQKKTKSWEICIYRIHDLEQTCLTDNEYWDGKPEWRP